MSQVMAMEVMEVLEVVEVVGLEKELLL